MFTLNPTLSLNIGSRHKDADAEKPSQSKSVAPAVPPLFGTVVYIDAQQIVMMGLVLAILLLLVTTLVYAAKHNQAVFAFKLARQATGHTMRVTPLRALVLPSLRTLRSRPPLHMRKLVSGRWT